MRLAMRSIQPRPATVWSITTDAPHGGCGDSEFYGDALQGTTVRPRLADRLHVVCGELGARVLLPASGFAEPSRFGVSGRWSRTSRHSSLRDSIGDVLGLCSGRDVGRLATSSIVTGMAEDSAGPRWSVCQDPREPVGSDRAATVGEVPVAEAFVSTGQPRSAAVLVGRSDLGPEASHLLRRERCKVRISHVAPPCGVVRDRCGANQAPPGPVQYTRGPAV